MKRGLMSDWIRQVVEKREIEFACKLVKRSNMCDRWLCHLLVSHEDMENHKSISHVCGCFSAWTNSNKKIKF